MTDKPIQEEKIKMETLNATEALFGFCGWLTSRETKTVMSETDDASTVVELINRFIQANNLPSDCRNGWDKMLVHPKEEP